MKIRKADRSEAKRKRISVVKRVALLGMLVAVAFVLSYIEAILPFSVGIPGIKLGLCHVVTIFALYRMRTGEVWFMGFVRVTLAALLFGNAMVWVYSAAGTVLSLLVMLLLKRSPRFSAVGVSIAGGVAHNVGQILCAAMLMETAGLIWYLPILLAAGGISGAMVGVLGGLLVHRFPRLG